MCLCNSGYTGGVQGQACNACQKGYFKSERGTAVCTACSAGTYSSALAAATDSSCIHCPFNKTSLPASQNVSDCVCPAGYTIKRDMHPNATNVANTTQQFCVTCPPGSFKDQIGNHNCSACVAGKYSNMRGLTTGELCQTCDPGATTVTAAATHISNCTCDKGYTGLVLGINCSACLPKQYKSTYGTALCSTCRNFSESPLASVSPDMCKCQFGYQDLNESCFFQCPKGWYASASGDSCEICPSTTFQPQFAARNSTFCLSCGYGAFSEEGSGFFSDCACDAGYIGHPVHPKMPPPHVNVSTLVSGCSGKMCNSTCIQSCVTTIFSNHSRHADCVRKCQSPSVGGCFACPANSYKEGLVAQICSTCPDNSASHVASPLEYDCMCDPGYTGGFNSTCCMEHKKSYGNSNVTRTCESRLVPAAPQELGSSRSFASWEGESLECTLRVQHTLEREERKWNASRLVAQTRNDSAFTNTSSTHIGLLFERNSVVLTSSHQELVCVMCAPGSYKATNGSAPCLLCPNATYGDKIAAISLNSTCQRCPQHATSTQGSTLLKQCQCSPGYIGRNGSSCTACPALTYKPQRGEGLCLPCPDNSFSPAAAAWCHCNMGYEGPDNYLALRDVGAVAVADGEVEERDALGATLWGSLQEYVLAFGKNHSPSARITQFSVVAGTNADLLSRQHWSRSTDEFSRFRHVGGTWTAVTQEPHTCSLCQESHLKPWDGPGMCEVCSERVLPWNSASWVSPTLPRKACAWECDKGSTHLDKGSTHLEPPRYSWDINQMWWSHGLTLGMGFTSNNLPNICVPCSKVPTSNPCAKGEYWNTQCTSDKDQGCSQCSETPALSRLFTKSFPLGVPPALSSTLSLQHWLRQDACPRACELGAYDPSSYESGISKSEDFNFAPTCIACPPAGTQGECPLMAAPPRPGFVSTAPGIRRPCGLGAAASDGERIENTGILEVQVYDGGCDPTSQYKDRPESRPIYEFIGTQ
eukprot:CAMPEP_0173063140 /NCGR_PEP_ID=MMETSP1102-20130122/4212_1 /TAXON_ID=49646 /ORGANISM="Geminigera sp., Strain Caron Lab Isolate" /LENGTH=983 /DNA_ID=CAMNT_0013929897 /DNA_START=168 /DNA_END=3119 /DNA_ORIENTATION=+